VERDQGITAAHQQTALVGSDTSCGRLVMDQYEQAVLDYLCGRPDRFVNAQFTIPYDGYRGGSCPDFLVLDFSDTTAYVVEVSATADSNRLIGRVRERETRWFGPLKDHLRKLSPGFAGWDLHVSLFVRDEEAARARRAVEAFPDVSVISLAKVLFSWNWDWQHGTGLPTNALRDPEKRERVQPSNTH